METERNDLYESEQIMMQDASELVDFQRKTIATCAEESIFGYLQCYNNNAELAGTLFKAVALGLIILFTIFGNALVLMSVAVSRNLRSSTHYLIVNLAIADLLLGTTVLPFSAVFEVTGNWYFGSTFCSIWAAVDVLCCTSSILSLCVISLDRYIGVTRPLAYSTIMVTKRTYMLILLIWTSSFAISIGPLLGWKEPPSDNPHFCTVNKQLGYVLFSVTGSFYLPMLIIIYVYWRIYKAALRQTKFLECGHKTTKQDVTLRVHLGGNRMNLSNTEKCRVSRHQKAHHICRPCPNEFPSLGSQSGAGSDGENSGAADAVVSVNNLLSLAPLARPEKSSSSSLNMEGNGGGDIGGGVLRAHRGGGGGKDWNKMVQPQQGILKSSSSSSSPRGAHKIGTRSNGYGHCCGKNSPCLLNDHHNHHTGHVGNRSGSLTPSPPSSSPERKLNPGFGKIAKFRRQKKAAKTLAIVVGVFLVCWFPFFFVLPLDALCTRCNIPEWLFNLFFWLGYFNSCLNPIIYGCTSREFQRAFRRILCRHSLPRPHVSRAIYRANMFNNNRFGGDRHLTGGTTQGHGNGNGIPMQHWP